MTILCADAHLGCALSVPLWEMTGHLKYLHLDLPSLFESHTVGEIEEEADVDPVPEDLPAAIAEVKEDVDEREQADHVHLFLAEHAVVTAVKGGKLKHINVNMELYQPFAIRSLVPYWVHMESWGEWKDSWAEGKWKWVRAAVGLRHTLYHASLWLGTTPTSGRRFNRNLTTQDILPLQAHFKSKGSPEMNDQTTEYFDSLTFTIEQYLPWLAEDIFLANQVAEAWNRVVDSGDQDRIQCLCKMCNPNDEGEEDC